MRVINRVPSRKSLNTSLTSALARAYGEDVYYIILLRYHFIIITIKAPSLRYHSVQSGY